MKARIELNPAIRGNYSFVCLEAPLFLDVINRIGYTSVVSPSILRGLKGKTLLDLDGVIDIEKGTIMARPVIKSLTLSPEQPKQNESVTFNYEVEFENDTVTELEVDWTGKEEIYDTEGQKTVTLKVKDSRNLWSDVTTLTFTVEPAAIVPPEPEPEPKPEPASVEKAPSKVKPSKK